MNRLTIYILLLVSVLLECCTADAPLNGDMNVNMSQPEDVSASVLSFLSMNDSTMSVLPSEFGHYQMLVHKSGRWTLAADSGCMALSKCEGYGCDTVGVSIAGNWWNARKLRVTVNGGEQVYTEQRANEDLEDMASHISAMRGAGFSYLPNTTYCMGIGMQVLNIPALQQLQEKENVSLVLDDYYPQMQQEMFSSDSLSGIDQQLAIKASADVNYGLFNVNITGNFDKKSQEKENREYSLIRLKQCYFTREINVLSAISLANESKEMRERIFASGFLTVMDNFVNDIHNTTSEPLRYQLCEQFVSRVGPAFISKSMFGAVLEYYCSVSKTDIASSLTAGGAAQASLNIFFKLNLSGDVNYSEEEKNTAERMTKKFNVRGGDVSQVTALTMGSQLSYSQVKNWMLSVAPETATLIDIKLCPVYMLVTDSTAHDALVKYFDEKMNDEK